MTAVLVSELGFALALKKPVGTIKTWLHRARQEVLARLLKRGMISEVNHELP